MSEPEPIPTPLPPSDPEKGKADAATAAVDEPSEQTTAACQCILTLLGCFLIIWKPISEAVSKGFYYFFGQQSTTTAFLLCLSCGLLLIPHAFLVYRWPHGDYGIGVLKEHFLCGARAEGFMIFFIQLPVNVIASLIVYAAGYIRARAWLPLKIMLFLLSIPAHLFAPARDSYELLVSYDFLHGGKPFDLATVPLRQTKGRANTLGRDYHMTLPGLENLTDSVAQVQKSAILGHPLLGWKNMTVKKCLERYQSGTYDQFSNVIVVSNWTAPQNENNSILDLTILSGYAGPKHQTWQALASLCPDSFFEVNNLTEPKVWKNVAGHAPHGACDPYVPKKWKTMQKNVFIKYCFSEEPEEVCRLMYSPLVLKLCFWILVAIVAIMILAFFLILCGVQTRWEPEPHDVKIVVAFITVCLSFVVMLFVTAYSSAAHLHPANKRLIFATSLLQAFCIINVVQLIDTICDAIIVPWGTSPWYTVVSFVWHWFLSGTFSMKISDRYFITNVPPGFELVPYSDLSSLWFKWLFVAVIKYAYTDLFSFLFVLGLFALPFAARAYFQALILLRE
ncbi:hypothetical protein AOQ84DRAFT_360764 [Glonium stellatum]|uniref:Uncharacterized protein n=1 Tax=Glonium stellatum TaxID=574774 RepID=A0A8E2F8J7_9PEZI|nr:hypothetical protein AOQ84DRAFT_360764 [Glonium stellatum]